MTGPGNQSRDNDSILPTFLIVGGQKCGSTWLWEMLQQHPDTDLRVVKDLQFFSLSHEFEKGFEHYKSRFRHLDPSKVVGDASSAYFYHSMLLADNVTPDTTKPPLPALLRSYLPTAKVIVVLRDPVARALSAFRHHLRRRRFNPHLSLREVTRRHPDLRILERGDFAHILETYLEAYPPSDMCILIYERDIRAHPETGLRRTFEFIGVDPTFEPADMKSRNPAWPWTHLVLNARLGRVFELPYKAAVRAGLGPALNRIDPIREPDRTEDIAFLRERYLPNKPRIEELIGGKLPEWEYGGGQQ